MDRKRSDGGFEPTPGTIEQPGNMPSDRDAENQGLDENPERHIRGGIGRAMDAVREVVEKEEARRHPETKNDEDRKRTQQGGEAMDAVREVVRKEQS
jgi:hypothetical protein